MPSSDTKNLGRQATVTFLRTLHEATLQDLLRARNCATIQLLSERNKLIRERYSNSWLLYSWYSN